MRRDLLVTALIFTIVGFLAGTLFTGALGGPGRVASPAPQEPAQSAGGQNLPEGHPPMEMAGRWQQLRDRAEANPEDDKAAVELANFLYDQGVWDQAAVWYRRALALNPRNADARTDLATTLYQSGRYDDAIREYETALEQEPDKPQALFGLARAKLDGKQDRAGAEQAYERLRRMHPTFEGVQILAEMLGKARPTE